ncbi:MAG TPA: hypothetical protein VGG33_15635 [Polyangia bacterium]
MLQIYKDTFVLAFKRAAAAWRLALFLLIYALLVGAAMVFTRPLGIVGGFALGLVVAACVSGYLSMLAQAVRGLPLRFADIQSSFGALFWDVISVMFAVWIIDLLVALIANGAGPNAEAIGAMAALAMAFFLNPLPEMIYTQRGRSFDLLLQSMRFVLANPVAWFLPNLIFLFVILAPTGRLNVGLGNLLITFSQIFSLRGLPAAFLGAPTWALPLLLVFFHYVMVFRGLLFEALATGKSNPRRAAWVSQLRP